MENGHFNLTTAELQVCKTFSQLVVNADFSQVLSFLSFEPRKSEKSFFIHLM